jgi:hypothetical protein
VGLVFLFISVPCKFLMGNLNFPLNMSERLQVTVNPGRGEVVHLDQRNGGVFKLVFHAERETR